MKETEWRLHSKTRQFNLRVEESRNVIGIALETGRFVISWSTGKDSTAMAHLIKSIDPETPIMIQYDDCDWPTKRAYADRICKSLGWEPHNVFPKFSVWEAVEKYQVGIEDICSINCSITQEAFLKPLDQMRQSLGCNGVFLGLRAEESNPRKWNFRSRGFLYQIKDGTWRCLPMTRWSALDAFAYHVKHGIEINPCYLQNRFQKPEDIRLSWALPTPRSQCNGMEHIRFYYPEQYRRLRERNVI